MPGMKGDYMKTLAMTLAAVASLAFGVSAAQADPILDFSMGAQSGSSLISYAGGSAPLVGSGIGVGQVAGNQTAMNSGQTLAITGGTLNFTSGAFTSAGANTWNFSSGGTFSVTG